MHSNSKAARVKGDRRHRIPTNLATRPRGTTPSSACPALRLAAGAVSLYARHTVAANLGNFRFFVEGSRRA